MVRKEELDFASTYLLAWHIFTEVFTSIIRSEIVPWYAHILRSELVPVILFERDSCMSLVYFVPATFEWVYWRMDEFLML